MKTIKVAPSTIAFLWSSCQRCWWRRVNGVQYAGEPFPKILQDVDAEMKLAAPDICAATGIEAATFQRFEKVLSEPIPFEQHGVQIQISGKVDKCIEHEDGTYGVLEMKLAEPTQANIAKYKPQCHAYVEAIESPVKGAAHEVSSIDLLFLEPCQDLVRCKNVGGRTMFSFTGEIHRVPVEIDRAWFHREILEPMAKVAGSMEMPPAGEYCEFCAAIAASAQYDAGLAILREKAGAA